MNKILILLLFISALTLSGCSNAITTPSKTGTTVEPSFVPIVETDVVIEIPQEDTSVSSPLTIEGLAPGTWFFEGQIQGEVVSESGKSLTTFPLEAVGEWMTEEHVRFEGEALFEAPKEDKTITVIIKNDNPSGLPENEKSQRFQFKLKSN